jgi:hypothetical protein
VGASFGSPNTLDIDPRISATWAPMRFAGDTVIRSGFGIYHGDGQLDDQNFPISNEIAQYSLNSIPNLSYPITPFLSNTLGIISPREADRNRKDMYVTQWGLPVQQALPKSFVGTLSYVGSKGTNLLNTTYLNLKDPTTGLRLYLDLAFGQIQGRGNRNNSSYQGFVVSPQRTFTHGLLVSANYIYAHEIDQGAACGGDSDFPQNPACPSCEPASGDFDVRHGFNANAVYVLPFGQGRAFMNNPRVARAVLGSWSVTTIVTSRSGLPINVTEDRSSTSVATGYTTSQRPNLVPGVSLTPPADGRASIGSIRLHSRECRTPTMAIPRATSGAARACGRPILAHSSRSGWESVSRCNSEAKSSTCSTVLSTACRWPIPRPASSVRS